MTTKQAAQHGATAPLLGSITKSASQRYPTEDKILRFALQAAARELAPHTRIRSCMRALLPEKSTVDIVYNETHKTAHYRNLMRCGMIWACPLCASTITEQRRRKIEALTNKKQEIHVILGGTVERTIIVNRWSLSMATLTLKHKSSDSLKDTMRIVQSAYRRFTSGRWYQSFRAGHNFVGTIRSVEITHGKNGWHPHVHVLYIREGANTPANTQDIELDIIFRWSDCVAAEGGQTSIEFGADYRAADNAAFEYISKLGQVVIAQSARWNGISEVVRYPVKMGRQGARSLWDLLADYIAGDVVSGELWIEAQRNLKGTRHLVASRGLYDALGTSDDAMADETLAQELASPSDVILASLTADQWRVIINRDLRGHVLAVASTGDRAALIDYLEGIL